MGEGRKDTILIWSVWLTAILMFLFSFFALEMQRIAIKENLELLNDKYMAIQERIEIIGTQIIYCNQIKKRIKK